MFKYIQNMCEKPEHKRRRAALAWSFGITAVLALAWLATLPVRFASLTGRTSSQTAAVSEALNQQSNVATDTPETIQFSSPSGAEDAGQVLIENSSY